MALNDGPPGAEERTVMAAHCSHCGGACLLKVHVKNGVITRIETDDGEEPQYRACARGRAMRQRVYAPDRILYPLKRVGQRGEGKFTRIPWDEALDKVAGEIKRVRDTYGPASIIFKRSGGDQGRIHYASTHLRLLVMSGGCSEVWCNMSMEGAFFAEIGTFGATPTNNTRDDLLNSRLIIMWGWNPAETIMHPPTALYLARAKEGGARIIAVDPRFTRTAATFASQWIPIIPGTDAAMMIAMAYVILEEGLQDQKFLDKYTFGFDKFKDYLTGAEDGIPKTPKWAEAITGVLATTIQALAREYATTKPAALMTGIGPGRTAFGEQYHRAGATLAAMTGNTGVHGGDAGVSAYASKSANFSYLNLRAGLPVPANPVEAKAPPRKNSYASWGSYNALRDGQIHQSKVADAILKGKAGGYPADYKLFYLVNSNYPNQYLNVNKGVEALRSKGLEFFVAFEQFMTPAARFADIILPTNTSLERNDIVAGSALGFYALMGKAVDSIGESRTHLEICTALAERLGIPGFNDKTEEEWLREITAGTPDIAHNETFKKSGVYKVKRDEPYVAFKKEIEDPEHNPFPTPSGKIEIYSQQIAAMKDPLLPPVPKYIETWESRNDPLARKYPLQLITTHYWRRAHSQYDNLPWLRELETQAVEMNSADARARGVSDGDAVRVFNDRGVTLLPARVTERIMPGVVNIPEGAWYDPDKSGVDRGGCANVLTKDEYSPGGAYPTHTSLVQVEKA